MFDSFRKPSVPPRPIPPSPDAVLAAVTAMVDAGTKFKQGRCPNTGSPMWVYETPREHAAECERLAATIPYAALCVAIHQVPGAIKPGPPPPYTSR